MQCLSLSKASCSWTRKKHDRVPVSILIRRRIPVNSVSDRLNVVKGLNEQIKLKEVDI
jgi:hypothetical protein